jgi:hypothetical protein
MAWTKDDSDIGGDVAGPQSTVTDAQADATAALADAAAAQATADAAATQSAFDVVRLQGFQPRSGNPLLGDGELLTNNTTGGSAYILSADVDDAIASGKFSS